MKRKSFYIFIVLTALCMLLTQNLYKKNEHEFVFAGGRVYQGGDIRTSTCYVVVNRNYDDDTLIDRILAEYILMNGKLTYLTFELYYKKNRDEPYRIYEFDFSE